MYSVLTTANELRKVTTERGEGNDWMDTCVSLVCIQPYQLSLHNREK